LLRLCRLFPASLVVRGDPNEPVVFGDIRDSFVGTGALE